jgi:riboflavin-specific deaminase-like protein
VLIGSKTIRVDNPQLTVRLTEGRNPDVIILDTGLSLGLQRKLFTVQRKGRIIIVTGNKSKEKGRKIEKLRQLGVEIIFAKVDRSGVINLRDAMKKILNLGINSILVEGGSKVFTAFLKSGLFDELRIFISPKVLGKGIPAIGDLGIKSLSKSIALHVDECEMTGDDVVIKLRNNEALG